MTVAVTLSARDIVDMSMRAFRPVPPAIFRQSEEERQQALLSRLRTDCQNMMGLIMAVGLDAAQRAKCAGAHIASAALDLPEEQAIAFLPLACIPDDFESWMDLRRYFDRVWCATARFDRDEPDGVAA